MIRFNKFNVLIELKISNLIRQLDIMKLKNNRLLNKYEIHAEKRLKELYKRMNKFKSGSSQIVKKITKSYYRE